MKKTVLFDKHIALNAKLVSFNGYEMPLCYTSVVNEHKAVRNQAGLFDVTHMGVIEIKGPDSEKFLNFLTVTDIAKKKEKSAIYTLFSNEDGMSIDDLLIFKNSKSHFFLIVNAGCKEKDLAHLLAYKEGYAVEILPLFDKMGILALQGPKSKEILAKLFPKCQDLSPFKFISDVFNGEKLLISRTGYTGSLGFELTAPLKIIPKLWDTLLLNPELKPVGLGSRDTLRLEMGYALYGHELTDRIAPTESVSFWTVDFKKPDFLGKKALVKLENSSKKRKEKGILFSEGRIPREGWPLFFQNEKIGLITSGNFSPTLNSPIAIGLFDKDIKDGEVCFAKNKNNEAAGVVVKLPFFKAS